MNEHLGEGTSTVPTRGDYYLNANINVENVVYVGTGNFTRSGNALDNVMVGGNGVDEMRGDLGNDALRGQGGNDILGGDGGDGGIVRPKRQVMLGKAVSLANSFG